MPQLLGMHWQSLPPCSWDPRVCLANVGRAIAFPVFFFVALFFGRANYGWITPLHPWKNNHLEGPWPTLTMMGVWGMAPKWGSCGGSTTCNPVCQYIYIYITQKLIDVCLYNNIYMPKVQCLNFRYIKTNKYIYIYSKILLKVCCTYPISLNHYI